MKYARLFAPLQVNSMKLKNRICMTAIDLNYCPDDGGAVSERLKAFYFRRAEGGAGLLTIGGCRIDEHGAGYDMDFVSIADDRYIPGHRELTDGIHARGAKVSLQLYHGGRYVAARGLRDGNVPFAPSPVYSTFTHETAPEMSREDIQAVIASTAAAAARAKSAGYDAVELLGSAGYLICQFLSPLTNLRTDEYGGSLENRLRFPRQLIAAVRAAVGPDFPLIMRMAGNDFMPGSNTLPDTVGFSREYEKCGIDMLSVTGGWHETRVPQLPGEVPDTCYAYLAQAIREAVSIPVIAANRIRTPSEAETVLALGQADCVGMCRTLLADPDWPRKAMAGEETEIRPCVGCNQGCLAATFFCKPVQCLVNADAGREAAPAAPRAGAGKSLLVIGGGPAGLEAALRAARSGWRTELWESSPRLGGQLRLAGAAPGKEDFLALIPYYETMLKQYGVTVRLGTEADAAAIAAAGFDAVIVAAGAHPRALPMDLPGPDIVSAWDVLSGAVIPGKHVVVLGGGAVGCETAQYLARQGALNTEKLFFLSVHHAEPPQRLEQMLNHSARTVSIVEVAPKVGSGFDPGCAWPVLKDLKRLGVAQYTRASIVSAADGCVTVEHGPEGERQRLTLPCDTLIQAVGSVSNTALMASLGEAGIPAVAIGDCAKTGRVLDAVRAAADAVAALPV